MATIKETDSGRCPGCGGLLEIPGELAEFCCLYCGTRLTHAQLLHDTVAPAEPPAGAMQRVLAEIPACLAGRAALLDSFRRGSYEEAFRDYARDCRPVFELLSAAASRDAEAVPAAAAAALAALAAELESAPKWSRRAGRREQLDFARLLVVGYFAPMVRFLALPVSGRFNESFRALWLERYPDCPYEVGSFEDISAGFRSFKDIFRFSRR